MADGDTIQVSNPQGQAGTIPLNQWEDALDQGYQLHSHIVMYDSTGKRGIVPKEQAGQARDAGYSIVKPGSETQFEKERAGAGSYKGTFGNMLRGLQVGPRNPFGLDYWAARGQAARAGKPMPEPEAPGVFSPVTEPFKEAAFAYRNEGKYPGEWQGPRRVGAAAAAGLGRMTSGVSARQMAEEAEKGQTAQIAGQGLAAAAPFAPGLAGAGLEAGSRAIERGRVGRYQSAVRSLAGKTPADLDFTKTITRAAPDVAQVARETDFSQKGNARVGEFHDMLNKRADEIWREEHDPQIKAQAQDPIDWKDIKVRAQDAITPELKANNPAAARAAQRWIDSALAERHIGTVEGADRMLRVINAEIPNLPEPFKNIGKIVRNAAQKGIRGELESKLQLAGQEGVAAPNTRWGSLREIADAIEGRLNVSSNEPFSLWKSFIYPGLKMAHTGAWLGGGLGYEMAGGPEGVPLGAGIGAVTGLGTAIGHEVLNQPGSRIARAVRGLGRTGLRPDVVTINPPGTPLLGRPAPATGGPAGNPTGNVARPPGAPGPLPPAGSPAPPAPVNAGLPTTAAHGPLFTGQPQLAAPIEMRETTPGTFEAPRPEATPAPEPELRQEVQEMARERERSPEEQEANRRQLVKMYRDIAAHPEATPEERAQAETRLKELGFNIEGTRPAAEEPPPETPEEPAEEAHIEGVTAKERKPAREKAQPVEKEFTKEQIEEGELLIRQELDMMAAGERPGHYYSENPLGEYNPAGEQSAERGVTSGGHWYGVKSMRDMLPWMREHHWAPGQLERALRNKDSAMYQRAVRSAIEFVEREKATSAAQEEEERAAIQGEEPLAEPEGVLPGFGQAVREQERGAAQVRAEGLAQEMGAPRSIEESAGRMERESPLFRYTEANPQNEMFPPVGKKRRQAQ